MLSVPARMLVATRCRMTPALSRRMRAAISVHSLAICWASGTTPEAGCVPVSADQRFSRDETLAGTSRVAPWNVRMGSQISPGVTPSIRGEDLLPIDQKHAHSAATHGRDTDLGVRMKTPSSQASRLLRIDSIQDD